MADDRLEQLERRVAELESLVRQLVVRAVAGAPAVRDRPTREPPPSASPASNAQSTSPAPPRVVVLPKIEVLPTPPDRVIDWEQWIGQRGLLGVGVLALLATGGFFLNYAIQHGWIPPAVRATGAIAAGAALAVWGDRLVRRGMLRYGAAIIGGGGGLVYLGIWAAAGPYALLGREVGVLLLAVTSGVVVALAVRHEVEALGIWALVGAYLAPIFLAGPEPEPAKFLAYMAVIGTSWLLLASRVNWRVTFDVALVGFFLLPASLIPDGLNSTIGVNYGVLGGVLALLATEPKRSTSWPEARLAALVMVWTVLLAVSEASTLRWTALYGGFLVTAIVWWQQLRTTPVAGVADNRMSVEIIVYLTPLLLVALAAFSPPSALVPWGGAVPLALAVLYLGSGWVPRTMHLVAMGLALLALAVSGQWDGAVVAAGWAIVAAIAGASGRWAHRPGASEVSVIIASFAFLQLFSVAEALRSANDPAFTGNWSLAWYVCLAGLTLTAFSWTPRPTPAVEDNVSVALWSLAAATLLVGGSLELARIFDWATFPATAALLLYWIAFAVILVLGASRLQPAMRALAVRIALLLVSAAYVLLFFILSGARPAGDRAFSGVWSLGWNACCIGGVLAARWWPADERLPSNLRFGRAALWWMAGGCLLAGGSIELHRAFTSELAGDLAISTFWLVYAGALVTAGFRLDHKTVRSAGLGVAALAALKIVLYDLSALEALYRVGSFFVLALITLAVAYAYNKKAKASKASAT